MFSVKILHVVHGHGYIFFQFLDSDAWELIKIIFLRFGFYVFLYKYFRYFLPFQ